MPYHASQDFAESTLSIPPEPLHAAIGCSGQVHHVLNALPLVQLPEGLQPGAQLGMHLILIALFKVDPSICSFQVGDCICIFRIERRLIRLCIRLLAMMGK